LLSRTNSERIKGSNKHNRKALSGGMNFLEDLRFYLKTREPSTGKLIGKRERGKRMKVGSQAQRFRF